jgi:AraC family transcriptional regulator
MEYVIREMPEFRVIGKQITTSMQNNTIPQLWGEYWSDPSRPMQFEVAVGLCFCEDEDCAEDTFQYMAGVVVKDGRPVPQGMIERIVPAARYAVFTHKGPLSLYGETVQKLYSEWLPNSGLELAPGDHIEWYDCRFKDEDPESEIDIYMPVK